MKAISNFFKNTPIWACTQILISVLASKYAYETASRSGIQKIIFDINSILELLHCADAEHAVDISEVYSVCTGS
jgi:hypothetical protein